MIKLEELGRRHIAGIAALALTLAGLGYFASQSFPARPVAELPELAGPSLAQLNPNQSFEERFLSSLRRLPANAFGSAEALRMGVGQEGQTAQTGAGAGSGSSADASQPTPVSPASESKFWSDREWRIASKAVEDFRSTHKPQTMTTGALSWRPPEEIANKR